VEAVTGTGKTMVGLMAAREELLAGGRVAVLVPNKTLLRHWTDELRTIVASSDVGQLGDGFARFARLTSRAGLGRQFGQP
jgi:RNA polymerase primary sigma factor